MTKQEVIAEAKSKGISVNRLAYLAGTDAANRNMRKDGRTRWNDEDYSIAVAEMNRILDPYCKPDRP